MEDGIPDKPQSILQLIRSDSPPPRRNSLYYQTSDESFERMEELCDLIETGDPEHLLGDIDIPHFDDTLDEVEFLLELSTTYHKRDETSEEKDEQKFANSSASSSGITSTPVAPKRKASRLPIRKNTSGLLSPNFSSSCHSSTQNQSELLSPSSCYGSHLSVNSSESFSPSRSRNK